MRTGDLRVLGILVFVLGGAGWWYSGTALAGSAQYDNAFIRAFNPEFAGQLSTLQQMSTMSMFAVGIGVALFIAGAIIRGRE